MKAIEILKNKYTKHDFGFKEYPKYFLGHCPEHDDEHPSFTVYKNGYYKCWACGFQGRIESGEFKELTAEEKEEIEKEKERQAYIFKSNLEFYTRLIKASDSDTATEHLSKRINNLSVLEKDLVRINLDNHFFTFPYTTAETKKIGRIVARKIYEKKIFKPEGTDIAGTIVAFNLHNAVNKLKINKGGIVIIVEGEFDVLALEQWKLKNISVIAVAGVSGFSPKLYNLIDYLKSLNAMVLLCPDNDEAGIKTLNNFKQEFMIELPAGVKDFGELFYKQSGDSEFDALEIFKNLRKEQVAKILKEREKIEKKQKESKIKNDIEQLSEVLSQNDIYNILSVQGIKSKETIKSDVIGKKIDNISVWTKILPAQRFIFAGYKAKKVGIFAGTGGVGKSYMALQLILSFADESEKMNYLNLFGNIRGKAGYITNEDDLDDLEYRLQHVRKYYIQKNGIDVRKINPLNYEYATMSEILTAKRKLVRLVRGEYQIDQDIYNYIRDFCKGKEFVIFDTLARSHALKVNDPGDMGFLIGIFEDISKETGTAILILAHTNKADLDGKDKVAGAAQITDNARFVMTLKKYKGSNDIKVLEFQKASYSKPTEPIFLKWQPADHNSKDIVELFDITIPDDFNETQKKESKKGRPRNGKKNSFQYKEEDDDEDKDKDFN